MDSPAQVIDMHAHWYPEGCAADVIGERPEFSFAPAPDGGQAIHYRGSHTFTIMKGAGDLPARLAYMDEVGIDVRVLSVGVLDLGWAGERAAAAARRINDGMAEVCRQAPTRLRFVASLARTEPRPSSA